MTLLILSLKSVGYMTDNDYGEVGGIRIGRAKQNLEKTHPSTSSFT
jgi:hypothetical protein